MEATAECMLVLIGATPEGKKELVGFQTGVRESAQSRRKSILIAQDAAMVLKLVSAAKTWRRLNGENELPKVVRGGQIPKRSRGH